MLFRTASLVLLSTSALLLCACGSSDTGGGIDSPAGPAAGGAASPGPTPGGGTTPGTPGNPTGSCKVPADVKVEDVSKPTTVVGTGTAASCSSAATIAAIAKGGVITFNCGKAPVVIELAETAKIFNKTPAGALIEQVVIDGGGLVTLSGQGKRRILYMNTCDPDLVWASEHCNDQATPRLTLQNLSMVDGNSTGQLKSNSGEGTEGGGAVFVRGGRFKVINSKFHRNVCDSKGPDLGGGALRVFDQFQDQPVYVVGSTFGGSKENRNECSNGGAISSIGVSWTIINSLLSYNKALGDGGNPAKDGSVGGGSGGAIYNDGNEMALSLCGTKLEYNEVNAFGSAIFFVSNNHTGTMRIEGSTITNNIGGSWYPKYPQISQHDDTPITVVDSTIK